MEITRTFDILELLREKYKKDDILAGKENGTWVKYTTNQLIEESDYFSYGLMALGLKKGDSIASLSNNRAEWNFADMGMSQIGVIHVPIYPTISLEEQTYILKHCEPKLVIVSDKALYEKIQPVCKQISSVREVYTFNAIDGARLWSEISALGKENADKYRQE